MGFFSMILILLQGTNKKKINKFFGPPNKNLISENMTWTLQ